MDKSALEYTSYRAGVEFESLQGFELIGSSYICFELDFNQEYSWIFNLAGKFFEKKDLVILWTVELNFWPLNWKWTLKVNDYVSMTL